MCIEEVFTCSFSSKTIQELVIVWYFAPERAVVNPASQMEYALSAAEIRAILKHLPQP